MSPADLPAARLPDPSRLHLDIPVSPPGGPAGLELELELSPDSWRRPVPAPGVADDAVGESRGRLEP